MWRFGGEEREPRGVSGADDEDGLDTGVCITRGKIDEEGWGGGEGAGTQLMRWQVLERSEACTCDCTTHQAPNQKLDLHAPLRAALLLFHQDQNVGLFPDGLLLQLQCAPPAFAAAVSPPVSVNALGRSVTSGRAPTSFSPGGFGAPSTFYALGRMAAWLHARLAAYPRPRVGSLRPKLSRRTQIF
eukprot:4506536-Pleurochrysis_carterae.AAC.1